MAAKRKNPSSKRRRAAATTDIIGARTANPRVPAKWRTHYDRLVRLRKNLLSRQNGLVNDARQEQSAFSLHMADAATDSFDRDLALSRASSEQESVYEIDQALERIRERTYGVCELTGKPIEAARLDAIPWTRFSLEAEQMLEKNGTGVDRARLAPRAAVPHNLNAENDPESQDSASE